MTPGLLRTVARIAIVAGACGSVALMLVVGHRNPSQVLLLLFAIWVLAPFITLGLADVASERWSLLTRAMLHSVMLILALGSLALYAKVAFGPRQAPPAFMFLMVPVGSFLLMTVVPIAAFVSRKLQRRDARSTPASP
jgi:hypothetical protein